MTEDELVKAGHGLIQATRFGVAAGAEVDDKRATRRVEREERASRLKEKTEADRRALDEYNRRAAP